MPKVWVYAPKGASWLAIMDPESVIEQVKSDLVDGEGGWLDTPGQEVLLKVVEMTQDEINNLPEFPGW